MVASGALAEPDEVVLAVDRHDHLTNGYWDKRSDEIARGLADRGVRPGDRVALLFGPSHWVEFAIAYLAVLKAGAVAVLLSPGAAAADLARAARHSRAVGVLRAPARSLPALAAWVAEPDELAGGGGTGGRPPPLHTSSQSDLAELVYPASPLVPLAPLSRTHADVQAAVTPSVDGWLVHAWAPGTGPGQHAVRALLRGTVARAATLSAFDPDGLCALVAKRRAVACGLTAELAAAVVASGAALRHDLGSIEQVLLSGRPSSGLLARLHATFAGAQVEEIDRLDAARAAPAEEDRRVPAAISQESMLWHEQFTPGSFNLPCLVRRYEGHLDVAALGWALSELARRHLPLRSTFEVDDGDPRQVVGAVPGPDLDVVDLAGLPANEREVEAARFLAEATRRPFDLTTGPLFQPRLFRLGETDHLLVVRLHHTVFDDWSVDVYRRELSALYAAGLDQAPSPLADPAVSFADFSRRERARMSGEEGAAERSWWQRQLEGAPLSVQLPIGDDRPGAGRPQPGEPLRLDLPPALASELRALAPRLRATPYMTVLAAFSVLLARTTGQNDVVIGSVVAHRNRSELESLIGCFTKKIPLRLRLDGDPTFAELVGRTRASLLDALAHQDLAFDAAVQAGLGPPAAAHGVVPQLAVVFQGETPQQVKLALPGLTAGEFEVPEEARRERHFSAGPEEAGDEAGPLVWGEGLYLGTFLILSLLETGAGLALVARGAFHRPAVRRLLEQFRALLADVVAGPSRPVSALSARQGAPHYGPGGADGDVVELRGFRARRSRLESALAECPGVAKVAVAVCSDGGDPRVVAYVVADRNPPPTLADLRHSLWTRLPGALCPAEIVVVDSLPRTCAGAGALDLAALHASGGRRGGGGNAEAAPPADGTAAVLAAMWGEARGRAVPAGTSYWQDFSFLQVLAHAREAGLAITDEQVARNRTLETLVADMGATKARRSQDQAGSGVSRAI